MDENGPTARKGVDLVLLVKLHHLLIQFLRVPLVFFLEFAHRTLKGLHFLLRTGGLGCQRPKQELDQNREGNDGQTIAAQDGLQFVEQPAQRFRQPPKHTELHDLLLFVLQFRQAHVIFRSGINVKSKFPGNAWLEPSEGDGQAPFYAYDLILGGRIASLVDPPTNSGIRKIRLGTNHVDEELIVHACPTGG